MLRIVGVSPTEPSYIVGVAASAGGLNAFTTFLSALPLDSGMAFVLFQHLDPKHESLLTSLLSKTTKLPVRDVRDGVRVLRDRVYIVPPNSGMVIRKGVLHLVPRGKRYRPIDKFFESLARDQQDRAIGIVLSGEASDGTLGLEAIKAGGGATFAQDEATALHIGMPRAAAASGCADFILPPDEIAKKLGRMGRTAALPAPGKKASSQDREYYAILDLIQSAKGVDFSNYKPGTIIRRIRRRMTARGILTLSRYAKQLSKNPRELDILVQDFLIHVTSFFRDPEVFKSLRSKVYPALLKRRAADAPIRIWVAGCSTGEEAYSHCINLLEFLGRGAPRPVIQLFATDISEEAVKKARSGIYSEKGVLNVPRELLAKYFLKVPQGYQVIKPVRDLCVFAKQNLAADTPFSQLDVVSCRNVLIYLSADLQKKVLGMFHYALKPAGFLVLGAAESNDVAGDCFGVTDAKHRIFSNRPFKGMEFISSPMKRGARRLPVENKRSEPRLPAARESAPLDLPQEIDRLLLKRFSPATVVVDSEFHILQFRGPINRFLEPISGKASLNLSRMAMKGLRLELIAAVERSKERGDAVRKEGIDVERDGRPAKVDVTVVPIKGANPSESCWAIVFTDTPAIAPPETSGSAARMTEGRRVIKLKRELTASHEALQSLIDQHEISNQELASAQEESLAHNEELRSLNEELETAKEELQSTNEELTTINDELNVRNRDLVLAGEFSEAVVDTVRESLLVLEEDLRVKSANRSYYETFKMARRDTENHFIYTLAGGQWDIPKLREVLETTLRISKIKEDFELEREFPGLGRKLLRFVARRIYREDVGGERRVLLSIEDITTRRQLEEIEALRKRDELRREFVAHVSHQFRTPLTAIRGYAETLKKGGFKDANSAMFIETIERHAIRLSRLVEDLLALSMLEGGKPAAHERISISSFAQNYVRSIEPIAKKKRIKLKVKGQKGVKVRADKTMLTQVFQNLCENAVKYSPNGGQIEIEVRARGGQALVSIRDRGIGIPRKELTRIFEPFHRTQGGRAIDPAGTGLGLSISKKIIESFGGKLWAERNIGKGSTFSVTLPLA